MNMVNFLSFKVSTVDLQKLRPDVDLTRPNAVLIRGLKPQKRMQRSRKKAFLKHVAFGVNKSEYYVHSEWGTHWTQSRSCDVFRNRKAAGNSTVASYASFGPNHQYYVEFSDWRFWKIDDAEIRRLAKENFVKFVSFGPQGAVVLFLQSGAYYFRNIPVQLQDEITGRARSGNQQDHNRIASVSLGNNDAYFVTFEDGSWTCSGGMPESMRKFLREEVLPNDNETIEQIAVSQDLEEWYLRANRRWSYHSRTLRSIEDEYKSQ